MDTHQLAGIADSSAKRYRAAAANVADFLVKNFPYAEGGRGPGRCADGVEAHDAAQQDGRSHYTNFGDIESDIHKNILFFSEIVL